MEGKLMRISKMNSLKLGLASALGILVIANAGFSFTCIRSDGRQPDKF